MRHEPPRDAGSAPEEDGPPPLTQAERERVWAWERLMTLYYLFAMAAMLAAFSFAQRFGESRESRWMVLGLVAVLVIAATYVQYSGRCPRCRAFLGRQSRLVLPQKCKSCGVAFPRKAGALDASKGR